MRLNSRKTSIALVIIIILSVSIGLLYQKLSDSLDRVRFPRPETEYVMSSGDKITMKEAVEKYSTQYGVPEYVIYAVIRTESSFNENAVSSAGAVGLMQLKPSTFEWLISKTKEDLNAESVYSPHINIKYGTYYLSYLKNKFGTWRLAVIAYNAGEGTVSQWLKNPDYLDENGELSVIPYEETRNHWDKVQDAIDIYKRLYYTD